MSYCKGTGTSNFPLRGGKHTLWEGGVRGTALIHAPGVLPPRNYTGIFSITDYFPTLLNAAGVLVDYANGGLPLDGLSHWSALQRSVDPAATTTPSPHAVRREVWIQSDPRQAAWDGELGDAPHAALRVDNHKLIVGPPGCPDSILPPYRYSDVAAAAPFQPPSRQCQAVLDAWCNVQVNCPGPNSNATRWKQHCGDAPQQFYARLDQPAPVEWRCYGASSLVPDHGHYDGRGSCYCSRGSELGEMLAKCEGRRPPSPPSRGCTRYPGSSVMLFDVVADPSETHNIAADQPAIVAAMLKRLGELNATLPPLDYPNNDPRADPTLHGGAWTPWVPSGAGQQLQLLPPPPPSSPTASAQACSKGCFNMSVGQVFHGYDLRVIMIPSNMAPSEGWGLCISACCQASGCEVWTTGPSDARPGTPHAICPAGEGGGNQTNKQTKAVLPPARNFTLLH